MPRNLGFGNASKTSSGHQRTCTCNAHTPDTAAVSDLQAASRLLPVSESERALVDQSQFLGNTKIDVPYYQGFKDSEQATQSSNNATEASAKAPPDLHDRNQDSPNFRGDEGLRNANNVADSHRFRSYTPESDFSRSPRRSPSPDTETERLESLAARKSNIPKPKSEASPPEVSTDSQNVTQPSHNAAETSAKQDSAQIAFRYALNQRVDGHDQPVDIPQHLLDRAKDFPKVKGKSKFNAIGQANILILQLAERAHAAEQRLEHTEHQLQQAIGIISQLAARVTSVNKRMETSEQRENDKRSFNRVMQEYDDDMDFVERSAEGPMMTAEARWGMYGPGDD